MRRLFFAATLLLAICVMYAADLPQMKEGLWSTHMETVDQPGEKKSAVDRSICRSHASDEITRQNAKKLQSKCTVIVDTYSDGKREYENECVIGPTTIHTKSITTMTGENSARSVDHATYKPAFIGRTETTMTMDSKYVGACPAGVEPGDIIEADGTVRKSRRH